MKFCFTIDDVIRDKTKAFIKFYNKVEKKDIDPDTFEATSSDLNDMFKFKTKKEYYKFLYDDYPFEIFGEAEICTPFLDKKMNLWLLDTEDYYEDKGEEVNFMWANLKEFGHSIGYTYFFLSRIATKIREAFFPRNAEDLWKKCDVLVTAEPSLIENKPKDCFVVKIETEYNKDCKADLSYPNLEALINDTEFLKKIEKK